MSLSGEEHPEVRSCPRCQQAAVTLVFTWNHTTWGTSSGMVTREYRCQSCGKKIAVRPKPHTLGLIIAGVLLIPTCVGIPFIVLGWRRWTAESRIPIVPHAPPPLIRYRGGPPHRTCAACSGNAIAMRITRNSHNGIPTGTEYEYVCQGCRREFTVESAWGQIFSSMAVLLVAGIAVAFVLAATHPGWRWGGSGVSTLIALLLGAQIVSRFANRLRNPAKPDELSPSIG